MRNRQGSICRQTDSEASPAARPLPPSWLTFPWFSPQFRLTSCSDVDIYSVARLSIIYLSCCRRSFAARSVFCRSCCCSFSLSADRAPFSASICAHRLAIEATSTCRRTTELPDTYLRINRGQTAYFSVHMLLLDCLDMLLFQSVYPNAQSIVILRPSILRLRHSFKLG